MIGANSSPYLKAWGVAVEKVATQNDAEITIQFLGIVSAPGREINFGGVPIVSDDYEMTYAIEDVQLSERDKITVTSGPDAGRYSISELKRSGDAVFATAKLAKIL